MSDVLNIEKVNLSIIETFLDNFPEKAIDLGLRTFYALLALFIGIQLIKIIRKLVKKSLKKANVDIGVLQFLDSFIKVLLYLVLFFMIGTSLGLDAASVVAVLGSAGVAIGLALQGSLSNIAGGVLILMVKPFRVGDYILEDNKKNEGTVTEISLIYTKLLTFDGKIIVLPNGTLANTSLTNYTFTKTRRVEIIFGIDYQSDLALAKKVLKNLLDEEDNILETPEKEVFVSSLSEHAVMLGIHGMTLNENYWSTKCRLTENIKLILDSNSIKISPITYNICSK